MFETIKEKLEDISLVRKKTPFDNGKFPTIDDRFNAYKTFIEQTDFTQQEKFYLIKGLEAIKANEPVDKINSYIHKVEYVTKVKDLITEPLMNNYVNLHKSVLLEKQKQLEYRQQLTMLEGNPFNDYDTYDKQIRECKKGIKRAYKNLKFA